MQRTGSLFSVLIFAACVQGGCGANKSNQGAGEAADGQGSEVAVSVVSGALNNTGGSALGWNGRRARQSTFDRALDIWRNGDSLNLVHFDPALRAEEVPVEFHARATWTFPFTGRVQG